MMYALRLIVLIFLFSGCSMLKFPTLNAPEQPQTVYNYEETFEKNPTAVSIGDKIVVVEQQSRTVTAGYKQQQKKLGFWKRTLNWMAGWSILTIVIVLVAMSFGITGPFFFLLRRFNQLKKTARGVIKSIDETKAVETNVILREKLASSLDAKEKRIVDDLKRS